MDEKKKKINFKKIIVIPILTIGMIIIVVNLIINRSTTETPKDNFKKVLIKTQNIDINEPLAQPDFYVKRQQTRKPITEYTWNNNQELIYSTNEGIFQVGANNLVFYSQPISYINFNNTGKGVFKSDNTWYFFDGSSKKASKISLVGEKPIINKSGNIIVSIDSTNVVLTDLEKDKTKTYDSKAKIIKLYWAYNSDQIGVLLERDNKQIVEILDTNLKKETTIELPIDSTFLDIDYLGKTIAFSKEGLLILKNTKTGDEIQLNNAKGSEIHGNWISNNDFILIESVVDHLGRPDDIISKVTNTGYKMFLTTTLSIPNKTNTSMRLKVNPGLTVLPIPENESVIWLLGMVSNTVPNYTGSSLDLIPVDEKQTNDAP